MIKRIATALGLASVALVGCTDDAMSPKAATSTTQLAAASRGGVIPGQYVVLFHRDRVARAAALGGAAPESGPALVSATAELATQKVGASGVLHRTFGHAVQGFAAELTDSAVTALRADPDVAVVEADRVMQVSGGGTESSAPWSLDRIDQSRMPLDGLYHYGNDGSGTSVYIVDTGINFTHNEFGGRAVLGRDFVTANGTGTDCHGHGTHVAGTVGGATFGVAKNVHLVAVRVLDCNGSGSESNVIAALDWVAQQKAASPAAPMVVNMSLGGGAAAGLDSAVERTVAAGVPVVVAAGNGATDACTTSPARAPDAITVGATDQSDSFAPFSNSGSCVDVLAPGVNIASAWIGSNTASVLLNGTSMATPHVTGAVALYLSANPSATPAQVAAALTSNATTGAISGVPANTPNALLYVAFLGASAPTPAPAPAPTPAPPTPAPSTAALVNPATGACLTLPGNGANTAALTTATCVSGAAGQQWTMQAVGTAGSMTAYSGAVCTDAYGGRGNAGDVIGTWNCNGQSNQRWTLTSAGTIVGINGLCLAAPTTTGGSSVTIQPCNGSASQSWTFGAVSAPVPTPAPARFTSLLTNNASGMCLDVNGASQDPGTRTIVWSCHGRSNQQWSMPAIGTAGDVRVYDGVHCLDDLGGAGQNGDVIGIYPCNGGANQQWTLTSDGQLRGINGKCAVVLGNANQAGAGVTLQQCAAAPSRSWSAPNAPTTNSLSVSATATKPRPAGT